MKMVNLRDVAWTDVSHNPTIKKRVILSPGEIKGITTLAQAVFRPGDVAGAHSHHDMAEVFMVAAGRGVITMNDIDYAVSPEVIMVAEPRDVHEIKNTGDEDLVIMYFGMKV